MNEGKKYAVKLEQEANWPITVDDSTVQESIVINQFPYFLSLTTYVSFFTCHAPVISRIQL